MQDKVCALSEFPDPQQILYSPDHGFDTVTWGIMCAHDGMMRILSLEISTTHENGQ